MGRHDLTDAHWARLEGLLPPQKPPIGRPARDHRTVLNAILWVLRTGAPWRDLPERYGPWATAASRFYRWQQAGIWERILRALQREADRSGRLDWALHYVDATIVRAHQHAAGAKRGRRTPKPSGAVKAGTAPRSTSGPKARASRSPSS